MKEPKYKIGDMLVPIHSTTSLISFHVIEIAIFMTSSKQVSVAYQCRVHSRQFVTSTPSLSKQLISLREIEVKPMPKEK